MLNTFNRKERSERKGIAEKTFCSSRPFVSCFRIHQYKYSMNTHKGKIALEGLRLFARHGYYEEERLLGREFILDIYVVADLGSPGRTDQLKDTLNYEIIIAICQEEMKIPSKLLEHVAYRIRERILALTGGDAEVRVRISKPNPLLEVELGRFFVELG